MMKVFHTVLFTGTKVSQTLQTGLGENLASITGYMFFCSVRLRWASDSCGSLSPTKTGPLSSRKQIMERLWQDFFSHPSEWWDHRAGKANRRYPDFRHKRTEQSLWLIDNSNPPWVKDKLAEMAPGSLQAHIFPWNVKLRKYVQAGYFKKAMELFHQMQREGMIPDKFTFLPILNACSNLLALEEGKNIHSEIIKSGLECNVFVASCLVDMYAKCGSVEDAWEVFSRMPTRDVVTWNAMILGYVKCGQGRKAVELSRLMEREGVESNPITFVGVLNACASSLAIDEGRRAHKKITDRGYESDVCVASSLVDMYAKCGRIEDARSVFNKMPVKDVVAWSAMILGHVKCGQGQQALELSRAMQREGVDLDPITFVGVLNACGSMAALHEGRRFHEQIIERGYESQVYVASSLVDMYSKCGSIENAEKVFNKVQARDVVSWNAMLAAYGSHGYCREALAFYEQMVVAGVEVNGMTIVSLLSACSHGGLVDEGMQHFESMSAVFMIASTVEHYACVVDVLGRAGRLHEAEDLIREMPCRRDAHVWMSLLSACRAHGNLEMGENVAKHVLEFDTENAGYLLLSNIYAATGKWDKVDAVHRERLVKGRAHLDRHEQ